MTSEGRTLSVESPIRERSLNGQPQPVSRITRRCARCSACFIRSAPGKTGLRGIWTQEGRWYCSQECFDLAEHTCCMCPDQTPPLPCCNAGHRHKGGDSATEAPTDSGEAT
jgi:hypothetical protein